jgi:hypothetical protein
VTMTVGQTAVTKLTMMHRPAACRMFFI